MKEFNILLEILSNHTKKNLPILDFNAEGEGMGKEQLLFSKIKSGEFDSDDEAAKAIYGTETRDYRFNMLKSRVKEKLFNHLFFVDFKESIDHEIYQNEQDADKQLYFANILYKVGELDIAEKLLNRAISIAKEGEYTEIGVNCLRLLRTIYSDQKRPNFFNAAEEDLKSSVELLAKEEEAASAYYSQRMYLQKSLNSRRLHFEETPAILDRIKELWLETNSFNIFEQYYDLAVWFFELKGDFDQIIQITDEVEVLRKMRK